MANLANELSLMPSIKIHLIKLTKGPNEFLLNQSILLYEPNFDYRTISWLKARVLTVKYLRRLYIKVKPNSILSFGDRYNSLAICAAFGLKLPVFVSNRMNPNLTNGFVIDRLNLFAYKYAKGILAQTTKAKDVFLTRYRNQNIAVIPNPFTTKLKVNETDKENIILNVGRFGDEKRQDLLIEFFEKLDAPNWKLFFIGDGPKLNDALKRASLSPKKENIHFEGAKKDVDYYYKKARIFAFSSLSEGFPNALGEAMSYGLPCISFNCLAGPSDLIEHGENGFLIDVGNEKDYVIKLQDLVSNESIRQKLGDAARQKLREFNSKEIAEKTLNFILGE